jgi:16S rRNA (guanine527-N7)-methyltransferase
MTPAPLSKADFRAATNVSRETFDRLVTYAELLIKWQAKINLVGRSTLGDFWRRHMLDSAQLWPFIDPTTETVTDLGSGAGFPGLVLAILGGESGPKVSLIESDRRKGEFLDEVIRQTGANARVVVARIEENPVPPATIVCARACAPLAKLLGYTAPLLRSDGTALILKGQSVDEELTEANKGWTISLNRHRSRSDPSGQILEIRDIRRVDGRRRGA